MCVCGELPVRSEEKAVAGVALTEAAHSKKDLVRQRVVGDEQLAVQGESMMRTRSARERTAFSRVPRPHDIAGLVA